VERYYDDPGKDEVVDKIPERAYRNFNPWNREGGTYEEQKGESKEVRGIIGEPKLY